MPNRATNLERLARVPTWQWIALAVVASLALTAVVEVAVAQRFRATVKVVEGEGIGVNPLTESLDFGDLPPGTQQTRHVVLENAGARPAYIMVLTVGGISELIEVDRPRFVLGPQETAKVGFRLNVPPSAPTKTYSGTVLVFRLPCLRS